MEKMDLITALELGDEGRLEYFEDMANLIELEDYLDSEDVIELLQESDMETFAEICENYFEEMLEAVPGDAIDVFTLLNNIKMSLMGLAGCADDATTMSHLADELTRFRNWFSMESRVFCEDSAKGMEEELTMRDALIASRLEKIEGDKYTYDFSEVLEYPIDEYIMTFADIIKNAEDDLALEMDDEGEANDGIES